MSETTFIPIYPWYNLGKWVTHCRVNRYLKLRRSGMDTRTALAASLITSKTLVAYLEDLLRRHLLTEDMTSIFRRDKSATSTSLIQAVLTIHIIGDVASSLSDDTKERLKIKMKGLTQHSWHAIRRPALNTLRMLSYPT